MACQFCLNFSIRCILTEDYEHQPSLAALLSSGFNGCDLCKLIWDSYYANQTAAGKEIDVTADSSAVRIKSLASRQVHRDFLDIFGLVGEPESIWITFGYENSAAELEDLSLDLVTREDDPAATYIKGRMAEDDPDSPSIYAKITSWIEICKTHQKCQWSGRDVMATRLICVGPADGSREPYLIDSENTPQKYIALSYCWGLGRPLVTTVGNLEAHKHRIPMKQLPQTVRDAITVTRKLRVSYLWVDALCIIQDSEEAKDWQVESSKMDAIYKNAFLTIAAEDSPNCNHGILRQRTAAGPAPYRIPFFTPDGNECGSVYICPSATLASEDAPATNGCLNTRGWTYQERKLSRRVLSYFINYIKFTCKTGSVSESGPTSFGPRFGDLFVGKMFPSNQSTRSLAELFDSWYKGIEEYTCRRLTYPDDKLPALSGLAHEVQNQVGGNYYAGLWERDLLVGLLWRTIPDQPSIDESPTRSPSWSWAAVNRPVRYGGVLGLTAKWRYPKYHRVSNLTARVDASTWDPMGRVYGGSLTVTGRLKDIRWRRAPEYIETTILHKPREQENGIFNTDVENSQFWGGSTAADPSIQADDAAKKFRSFDPDIGLWDPIFAITDEQPHNEVQPARSATIPGIGISWAPHDNDHSVSSYKQVGVCTFDADADRPERLCCISLTEDMGLVLERVSDESRFRRVGFYRTAGSWWLQDVPCTEVVII